MPAGWKARIRDHGSSHHLSKIFAAGTAGNRSLRPLHTVQPLALTLGLEVRDEFSSEEDVPRLVDAAQACTGVVLISWRRESMATIAGGLLGEHATPPPWVSERFDMVWVFDLDDGRWNMFQVPQLLLPGDRSGPIA